MSALRMTSVPVLLILLLILLLALYCINSSLMTSPVQADDVGTTRSPETPLISADSISAIQPLLGLYYDKFPSP
jgi:hypothetical protein